MSSLITRLTNTGTLTAIVSAGIIIAQQLGLEFEVTVVNNILTSICAIGVALGILNNPTTDGIDNPTEE